MRLLCLSIDFNHAPVSLRGKVALSSHETSELYEALRDSHLVREIVVLCTCNRTEIYTVIPGDSQLDLLAILAERKGLDPKELGEACQFYEGRDVMEHVFSLAAGLESMVLGETEILGQLKKAYANALAADSCGKVLNLTFQRAFSLAKQIRTGTAIGRFRVSVASVAVDAIADTLKQMNDPQIAVWGTGPVGRATVRSLAKKGVKGGTVISRDLHRAEVITHEWKGKALHRDQVSEALETCDVFVSCTGAPHLVVTPDLLDNRDPQKPLLLVDLAVPQDIDPAVAQNANVTLVDMDHLDTISQAGMKERVQAREAIAPLLAAEADSLWHCTNASLSQSCLADWRKEAHKAYEEEKDRIYTEWQEMPEEFREKLDLLGTRLLERMLKWPMKAVACAMREGLPCADIFAEQASTEDHSKAG